MAEKKSPQSSWKDKQKSHLCNLCGKGFPSESQLNRHCVVHQAVKPPSCSICRKRFTLQSDLKVHWLVHKGVKPHKCIVCGKKFTLKCHLDDHSLVHSGLKPHKCIICGKDFTLHSNLVKHLLIHSGVRPFKCSSCGRDFTQKAHLEEHSLIHSGVKPHACHICAKRFTKKYHLNRHVLTHSKVDEPYYGDPLTDATSLEGGGEGSVRNRNILRLKPHLCKICGKRFKKKYHLNRHNLTHNKAGKPSESGQSSHSDETSLASGRCEESTPNITTFDCDNTHGALPLDSGVESVAPCLEVQEQDEPSCINRSSDNQFPLSLGSNVVLNIAKEDNCDIKEEPDIKDFDMVKELEVDVMDNTFLINKKCGF